VSLCCAFDSASDAVPRNWLHHTFLYQRIQLNPRYYGMGLGDNETWRHRLDGIILETTKELRDKRLVDFVDEESGSISSTQFGETMSKVSPACTN
jgi:ATP-dependent DNA helicase HFM1/MER3